MNLSKIDHIVIVGGGTAGWMAAASLARQLQDTSTSIRLIESPDVPTVGVGEATLPGIRDFNRFLGIDEVDFIRKTQASFKLGIRFADWHVAGQSFFHPFAGFGASLGGIEFHHCLERAKEADPGLELAAHCLPVSMAEKGRFAQPHPDPEHPLADYKYAFHFDALLYAAYLRDYAVQNGVTHSRGLVVDVRLDAESGFVESLRLESGETVGGDLFIDCTGFAGLLIEKALDTGYENWSHWLPVNRALAVGSVPTLDPQPYTLSTARDAGWQWRIPLQHRVGNGYVYSARYCGDEQARETLLANIDGEPLGEPRMLRFTTGLRRKFWNRNCVALGLASGFLEPLESTSISLIQTGLTKLLMFYPHNGFNDADTAEANRLARLEMERIRDFIILHYCLNRRSDGELWEYCRNMTLPDELQHKIDVFRERGHLVAYEMESFELSSWLSIFYGHRLVPRHYDIRAARFPRQDLISTLSDMRQTVEQAAEAAPAHADFIARHCAADADPLVARAS